MSQQLYSLLISEINGIGAEIRRLEEKRRQLQATARLYEPQSPEQTHSPTMQSTIFDPVDLDEEFKPGSLKSRILHYISNNGPKTVPQIQTALEVTHMPSVFRAVGQLKELGFVFIDDNKRVNIKR